MKKRAITFVVMLGLVMTACGINEQGSGSNKNNSNQGTETRKENEQEKGAVETNEGNRRDAFELASIINENSNIDLELLSEAEFIEGKCSYVDGGNFSTIRYDGEVYAYAFGYPEDQAGSYWTQIYVSNEDNDVLGIHVGDDLSDAIDVVSEYGYIFENKEKKEFSYMDADYLEQYERGDVHINFYTRDDKIVQIELLVHN